MGLNTEVEINKGEALTMHIDLNSCFATIEQQANRLLRGRPVAVSAYDTPKGFVLAASYEAKRRGVKLGVNNSQARYFCPGIVILTPDPPKYREAHRRFKEVLLRYASDVVAKSIDEFVIDLRGTPLIRKGLTVREIGQLIKQDIKTYLGEAVTVNIGAGTNRFLAKLAAGLNKPDGLDVVDYTNLESVLTCLDLLDLPGINVRYKTRLALAHIYTPIDFLKADVHVLRHQVFKGINGYYWHMRLRGQEVDDYDNKRQSIGHQYALSHKTTDMDELSRILMKLCEKVGRRMRKNNYYARGIHLYIGFDMPRDNHDNPVHAGFEQMNSMLSWHKGISIDYRLYSTDDIYNAARYLLESSDLIHKVRLLAVTVFNIIPWDPEQLNIFDMSVEQKYTHEPPSKMSAKNRLSDSLDSINDRYGEMIITPALAMGMDRVILDRIAFGQVKDL